MRMTRTTLGLLLSGVLIASCGDRNSVGPTGAGGSTGTYSLLPPGVYLDSAKLLLHVSAAFGQTVVLHPQQSAWDEHTATWDVVGPALSPFVLSTFHPQDTGWVRVEVTGVVKLWLDGTWPNFGLVLDQNSPEYLRSEFSSRETRALGPRLKLYCSIADSCPVYGFAASADAFVDASNPAANFGSDSLLETGWTDSEPGERRTLIVFDFQAPQEQPVSRLGDRVWLDSDRDGVQDADETGFAGVTVKLWNCSKQFLAATTTDANGHYRFDSLAAGSYQVEFARPDGFAFTPRDAADSDLIDTDADSGTGRTECVVLGEGSENYSLDAGLAPVIVETRPHALLGDKVWLDSDRDGVQDPGEPGLAGVTVTLWSCPEQRLADCFTDADGSYHFDSLEAGSYALQFALLEGYEFAARDQADSDLEDSDADPVSGRTICFNLPEGSEDASWDAGLVARIVEPDPQAAVGDRVWNDLNADGLQNDGEPGLGGVEVALLNCEMVLIQSSHTAQDGAFGFDSLVPGSYRLRFAAPDGYHFSPQINGDWAANSDADPLSGLTECFELSGNEVDLTRDAGLFVPATEPSGCTHTRNFWKEHDGSHGHPDWITPHLPILLGLEGGAHSVLINSASDAGRLLSLCRGSSKNGITRLSAELLAVRLNMAEGASADAISQTLQEVDAFLADHSKESWCGLDHATRRQVNHWKHTLHNWNHGLLGPVACED